MNCTATGVLAFTSLSSPTSATFPDSHSQFFSFSQKTLSLLSPNSLPPARKRVKLQRNHHSKIQAVAEQIREAYMFYLLTNPQVHLAISRRPADRDATKLRWFGFKNEVQNMLTNAVIETRFFSFEIRKNLYDANPMCAISKNQIHSMLSL
ncbi:MAG: hypothetical protein E6J34_11120 [Chloroflexi bacterium]|nr:MAG: hypothetical protein E6J34_11120 [Chloroflexota bacterium]